MESSINNKLYEEPKTSDNPLKDVMDWLNENNIVVLYNRYNQIQIYHNNCDNCNDYSDRICCANCVSVPGILDKGEWDWYILDKGNKVCKCKDQLTTINNLIKANSKNVFMFNVQLIFP